MKSIFLILMLSLISFDTTKESIEKTDDNFAYYSDYFVFLSDDDASPLVIPMDLNWSPVLGGYEIEFKSWYGTRKDWPVVYNKQTVSSRAEHIPQESFQHKNINGFNFHPEQQEIKVKAPFAPEVTVIIPNKDKWILAPSKSEIHKETYAAKTTVRVKNKEKNGWILYERIRWKKDQIVEFGDFGEFFWIPLIIDGNLYHFEQHKNEKLAFKWTNNSGQVTVDEISDFQISVTKTVKDSKSGRKAIPKEVQITAGDFDIGLSSKGEQVGYGKEYPKGLAYYRQSLLMSHKKSKLKGYGMLELILENN